MTAPEFTPEQIASAIDLSDRETQSAAQRVAALLRHDPNLEAECQREFDAVMERVGNFNERVQRARAEIQRIDDVEAPSALAKSDDDAYQAIMARRRAAEELIAHAPRTEGILGSELAMARGKLANAKAPRCNAAVISHGEALNATCASLAALVGPALQAARDLMAARNIAGADVRNAVRQGSVLDVLGLDARTRAMVALVADIG